mmetsp:Transcript_26572/g.64133  ORF Transcript_26572/g.64133 Transcript_26572/m.64133 type:complete len:491 (+) Transcript_26572:580-2052(+)
MGNSGRLGLGHFKSLPNPQKVTLPEGGHHVVSVSAGFYHSLALTRDKQILAWGSGDTGQLGQGEYQTSSVPLLLDLSQLDNKSVQWASVAAGEYHSGALTVQGKLFTWGMNNAGQLGLGHTERTCRPTAVGSLTGKKVLRFALGATFGVCVIDNSETLSWGLNLNGQLGHGDTSDRLEPSVIVQLRGVMLKLVACGGRHCASLDENGRMWVWGSNTAGQLCLGDSEDRRSPVMVQGSADLVLGHISCGYSHTLLLSEYEASEVQSRSFYTTGIITMNDPAVERLCIYGSEGGAKYQPLSVLRQFYNKHGFPMSAEPVFIADPVSDRRLLDMILRVQAIAGAIEDVVERVRMVAVCCYYEMGGAHADLVTACRRHVSNLLERLDDRSGVIPLAAVRLGDSRHRALLCKLVCDRMNLPCCLLRGSVPLDPVTGEPSIQVQDAATHHWNVVRAGETGACYIVDCCVAPSRLSLVEGVSPDLLATLLTSDKDLP